SWYEKIIEARCPETQRRSSQQDGPCLFFFWSEGPDRCVSREPCLQFLCLENSSVAFYAPIVDGDRDIKKPMIASGKIKIDESAHSGHLESTIKQNVVAEQV